MSVPPPPPEFAPRGVGGAIAAARERARRSLLRNHDGGPAAVSPLELFFDLIFVFAVTQLSHYLLVALTPLGAVQTAILFGAVWWAWMYTTWATNWVDPDRGPNRVMLGAVMLASLVMSTAIPDAFGEAGLRFALAYVAIQIGRSLFVAATMARDSKLGAINMVRATVWFVLSAPLWIGGALVADVELRMGLWLTALGIEYAGPLARFWVPGLGRSSLEDWRISGSHMAERCGLFIIIALGETLIITGATYAEAPPQPGLNLAMINAFVGSFAMWWIYFDIGARRGAHHIEAHDAPGLIGRQAFTYWHIPIVAGIIVLAVADELVLAHPLEAAHADFVAVMTVGMVLFIGGNMGFKRISSGNPWFPGSHQTGLFVTLALGLWGFLAHPPTLVLFAAATLLFIVVAVWEWGSFHGGWLERMEARGWWLGKVIRASTDRRIARRTAARRQR